jgi:preprotein translocase subunit YajC
MSYIKSMLNVVGVSALGMSAAFADSPISAPHVAGHSSTGGLMSMLPMLVIFVVVFYFLLVRPQTKRAKETKNMMSELKVGDEIATTGGIVGRLDAIKDDFITLVTNGETQITLQKAAIASILPKGTMESMK